MWVSVCIYISNRLIHRSKRFFWIMWVMRIPDEFIEPFHITLTKKQHLDSNPSDHVTCLLKVYSIILKQRAWRKLFDNMDYMSFHIHGKWLNLNYKTNQNLVSLWLLTWFKRYMAFGNNENHFFFLPKHNNITC